MSEAVTTAAVDDSEDLMLLLLLLLLMMILMMLMSSLTQAVLTGPSQLAASSQTVTSSPNVARK